jgi:environmental stress-induced protein Ves
MGSVTILRAAARSWVPWKNGGGLTSVVASDPPESVDAWDWRISVAKVDEACLFSLFAGVERILTVLSGSLELTDASGTVTRIPEGRSTRFDGGAAVAGRPLDSAVTDLNVMVRRGRCQAHVEHMAAPHRRSLRVRGETFLLFFAAAGCACLNGETIEMAAHDAVLMVDARGASVDVTSDSFVHLVSLSRGL